MGQEHSDGNAPDHADAAFHPPLLLFVALALGFVARWLFPLAFLPFRVSSLGLVVVTISFVLFFWSVFTMRARGASIPTGEPTDVIVGRGPFRFSRNPIYLSMLLLQLGVGIWTNSPWFIALAAVSALLLSWGVISREERYLERKFAAEYSSYKARVRRWI